MTSKEPLNTASIGNLSSLDKDLFINRYVQDQRTYESQFIAQGLKEFAARQHKEKQEAKIIGSEKERTSASPILKPRNPLAPKSSARKRRHSSPPPPKEFDDDREEQPPRKRDARGSNEKAKPRSLKRPKAAPSEQSIGETAESEEEREERQAKRREKRREKREKMSGKENIPAEAERNKERKSKSKDPKEKSKDKSRLPAGLALMHGFSADNITKNRLTLGVTSLTGFFNKGKVSMRAGGKAVSNSQPFSESQFLSQHKFTSRKDPLPKQSVSAISVSSGCCSVRKEGRSQVQKKKPGVADKTRKKVPQPAPTVISSISSKTRKEGSSEPWAIEEDDVSLPSESLEKGPETVILDSRKYSWGAANKLPSPIVSEAVSKEPCSKESKGLTQAARSPLSAVRNYGSSDSDRNSAKSSEIGGNSSHMAEPSPRPCTAGKPTPHPMVPEYPLLQSKYFRAADSVVEPKPKVDGVRNQAPLADITRSNAKDVGSLNNIINTLDNILESDLSQLPDHEQPPLSQRKFAFNVPVSREQQGNSYVQTLDPVSLRDPSPDLPMPFAAAPAEEGPPLPGYFEEEDLFPYEAQSFALSDGVPQHDEYYGAQEPESYPLPQNDLYYGDIQTDDQGISATDFDADSFIQDFVYFSDFVEDPLPAGDERYETQVSNYQSYPPDESICLESYRDQQAEQQEFCASPMLLDDAPFVPTASSPVDPESALTFSQSRALLHGLHAVERGPVESWGLRDLELEVGRNMHDHWYPNLFP